MVQLSFAQTKTVRGIVTSDSEPLPGVSVIIKGTTIGTETDFDGNYTIKASQGDVLVFGFIGMTSKEIVITDSNTINVELEENSSLLDEIIITAQGIKKEKRSLGYSITKIDGTELENKPEADVSRSLQGKVAGVQISSQSGSSGEETTITIRGSLSISGENGPLIIVNNVPFSGSLLDIDPSNIEQYSVKLCPNPLTVN